MANTLVSDRMKWFVEARFGLSLHFGLYSIAGRGQWIRSVQRLSIEAYQQYFDSFQPDANCARVGTGRASGRGERLRDLPSLSHQPPNFLQVERGSLTSSPLQQQRI